MKLWMHSLPGSKPLRLSGPAEGDLVQIAEVTQREWGAVQKRKYLEKIKSCFKLIRNTPAAGVSRDDIDPGLRSHPAGRHIVFYRDTEEAVVVVRILHMSMDVEMHLTDRED